MVSTERSLGGSRLTTAAVRAILATNGRSAGRADQLADRLADAIQLGLLPSGERLPAEATLADQLGVATLTLREALAILRRRGLVTTRRGRAGGSFVEFTEDRASSQLRELTVHDIRELADHRQAIFATSAALAARRASAADLAALRRGIKRLESAGTTDERRRADAELAIQVAAAAQSSRLTLDEARLRAELGDLVWAHAGEPELATLLSVRRDLVGAIRRHDGDEARRLAERQVALDTEHLLRRRLALYASSGAGRRSLDTFTAELGQVCNALDDLAAAFARDVATSARDYTLADLTGLRPRILDALTRFADLTVGCGIVTAPGLLADASHWLEWWWLTGRTPRALRVNLDPAAPDFFDYPRAEWFATPLRSGTRTVSGPLVDYACTNQYTVTVAVPVRDRDRPLGIVGADIPWARVEQHVMPWLAQLPEPVALVGGNGRVLAANSASVRPAALRPARHSRAVTAPGGGRLTRLTGWTLVRLPR